ncbi:MAG: hypothetical protein FJ100_09045 [Deltaproteobacteria bacterium]|nr:hypothetical protein [Deltaproteobacteria bacterium]
MVHRRMDLLLAALLAGAMTACAAAQGGAGSAAAAPAAAPDPVDAGLADAGAGALVVVAAADWCEPCNELHHRFLDTPAGQQALAGHTYRELDVDTPAGGAAAAELRILGYPSTVVLRRIAGQRVEVGRIEGFDSAAEYAATLKELLTRTTPVAWCAQPLPPGLPPAHTAVETLPVLRCAADSLRGPDAQRAADLLRTFAGDPVRWSAAATWDDSARLDVLAAIRLLGRYQTRVARDHMACATTFGALATFAGTPDKSRGGMHYWRARCLLRGGQPDTAQAELRGYLAGRPGDAQAAELVADFLVHEALGQPWGPPWALELLGGIVQQKPDDHWAHYLMGAVLARAGRMEEARAAVAKALALKPESAIYLRHRDRWAAAGK